MCWGQPVLLHCPTSFTIPSPMNRLVLLFAALLLLASAERAVAQSYAMTARSFEQSPVARGMGDAAVAFPTAQTAFFYNPAHVARVAGIKPRFTVLGVNARLTDGVFDYYDFYTNSLEPALDEGIDNLNGAERQELYDEAFAIGRARNSANVNVVLPSALFRVGPVGVGAGVFNYTGTQFQIGDAGAGVPQINLDGQVDVMGTVVAAADFAGLAVGASAKYTQRYLTLKHKPLDAFGEDEPINVYAANSMGFDVGALYTLGMLPIPGSLTVGAALFDVAGTEFAYEYDRSVNDVERNRDLEEEEIAYAEEFRQVSPSYRFGVAYTVPSLFGLFGQTGVAVDYMGYSEPMIKDRPALANLHVGAQVQLAKAFAVRAGLAQGYPTAGAGLHVGPLQLDYAYAGQEEGRLPGQNPSWHHQLRFAFGF